MKTFSASIADIAQDLRSGFASGEDDTDGVVQFRMNNVERDGQVNWARVRRVPKALFKREQEALPGDILFNSTNSPELVGKTALFNGFSERVTFSNHFIRIRLKRDVADPAYVSRWLQREFSRGRFRAMCRSWVNQASITKAQLSGLTLPLPPLDEQRRIAAILDKADALRQKRKRAIALLDSLTQSIFLEMFGDPLVNDRRLPSDKVLSDVAEIGSGITKGRQTRGIATRLVPYLAVANVQEKRLDLSEVKEIEATEAEVERCRLLPNDLLLTEGGDPDKLGRGTLWRGELAEAIHQNHVFRVRFGPDVAPLFANWLIGSSRGKTYFLQSAKQTTGIASINKTQLSNFPMLVPPMSHQMAFVDAAESVERRRNQLSIAAELADSLFSSLQHRAFSGQL